MYSDTLLFINGEWRSSSDQKKIPVVNPANEETIGYVAQASIDDLEDAVQSSLKGFNTWKNTSGYERQKTLIKAANLLRENAKFLAETMSLEQGKLISQAYWEILSSAETIEWFASEAIRTNGQTIPSRSHSVLSYTLKAPVGPVAAFTPWNFPILQIVRKLGAALAAGCSIIIKAPEETPNTPAKLVEIFVEAGIPNGVINLLFGIPNQISEFLIKHEAIKKISFTGSTLVGKQLSSLAGMYMKKTTMELGGHAPVIVFKDANLVLAAKEMVAMKFHNAGQVCISPTRFIIEQDIYDDFIEILKDEVSKLKVGPALEQNIHMGPVIHKRALDNITNMVTDATTKGAKLVLGGNKIERKGYFFEPTILKDVPVTASCMNNEPFGPLILCIPFNNYEDAVTEANRLPVGLAAYAYSNDNRICLNLAKDIESGMLTINHLGLGLPELPFGGIKESGYGTEGGNEAINAYLDTKLITISSIN